MSTSLSLAQLVTLVVVGSGLLIVGIGNLILWGTAGGLGGHPAEAARAGNLLWAVLFGAGGALALFLAARLPLGRGQ